MKDVLVIIIGIIALAIIIFPSLIPDFIPFFGAMDEVAAAYVLLSCLKYFGLDLTGFFSPKTKKNDTK